MLDMSSRQGRGRETEFALFLKDLQGGQLLWNLGWSLIIFVMMSFLCSTWLFVFYSFRPFLPFLVFENMCSYVYMYIFISASKYVWQVVLSSLTIYASRQNSPSVRLDTYQKADPTVSQGYRVQWPVIRTWFLRPWNPVQRLTVKQMKEKPEVLPVGASGHFLIPRKPQTSKILSLTQFLFATFSPEKKECLWNTGMATPPPKSRSNPIQFFHETFFNLVQIFKDYHIAPRLAFWKRFIAF